MNNKAIFVVNVGEFMSEQTSASHQAAAARWEADYVEVREFDGIFHPAALKLKAFELCEYDNLLILDADTLIRQDAPNIFGLTPEECFSAVKNNQAHTPRRFVNANFDLFEEQVDAIVEHKGVEKPDDIEWWKNNFFNSGVVLVNRKEHALTLAYAFRLFEGTPNIQWWDQVPLNMAVAELHGGYTPLPSTWNYMFPPNMDSMYAYIYHLAGNPFRYDVLASGKPDWRVSE